MEGMDLFLTELVQYSVKAVSLLAIMVAGIFVGVKIRKIVNKKKEQQETAE
ncbi:MAG: hypothetical protein J6B50_02280 [Lachnospiraceae bacterium]|nr:hypothetical protein [Lachnospiraceae bacterium]